MNTPEIKSENKTLLPVDKQKDIENHKKAASHLEAAAKEHLEAAKHHEAGNHDKAAQSTVTALGHTAMANDCHKEDIKNHACAKK
jgi:hypothetical protein